jgi:hypothetical protein
MVETRMNASEHTAKRPPTHDKTGLTKDSSIANPNLSAPSGYGGGIRRYSKNHNPRTTKDAPRPTQKSLKRVEPLRIHHEGLNVGGNTLAGPFDGGTTPSGSVEAPLKMEDCQSGAERLPKNRMTKTPEASEFTNFDDLVAHLEGVSSPEVGRDATSKALMPSPKHLSRLREILSDLDMAELCLGDTQSVWDKPPSSSLPHFKKDVRKLLTP